MIGLDDRRAGRGDRGAIERRPHAADLVGAHAGVRAGGRGGRRRDAHPEQRDCHDQPTHRRRTVHGARRPATHRRPRRTRGLAFGLLQAYDRRMDPDTRPCRAPFWIANGAVVWALAFTVWALTAPFYEPSGQTILEANDELSVRIALLLPAVISALVWRALRVACRDGRRERGRSASPAPPCCCSSPC